MTISTTTSKDQHNGNDSATTFNYNFKILDQSHLEVIKTSTAGVDSTLTITTDYTVSGVGDDSGSISYPVTGSPLATGEKLTIRRKQDFLQSVDLQNQGGFFAEVHEEAFDKQAMFALQNQEELDRTLRAPVTDPTTVDLTLPAKDSRKGTVLGFNATTGDPEVGPEIADVASIASITSDIATLADIEDGTDATDAIQTVASISSDVTSVAGVSTEVGRLGTTDAVADMALLGTSACVADMAILGTADVVSDLNTLGTADVVSDLNTLGTADIVSDMNTLGTSANVTAMGLLGTSACVADMAILGTSDVVSDLNTLGTSAIVTDMDALADKTTEMGRLGTTDTVADMALLGTSDCVADMALLGTSDCVADMALLGTSACVADMAILGTADVVSDLNTLGTADVVADLNTLGTADVVADLNTLGTADVVSDMNTLATSAVVADLDAVADKVTEIGRLGTTAAVADMALLGTSDCVADMALLGTADCVADMALLGTSDCVADMALLGTSDCVADMALLGTSDCIADMNTLATSDIVADLNTLATSDIVSDLETVADNIAGVNSFADRYRVASSAPASSLDEGDLYFNTTDNKLYHYNGSAWVEITAYSHPTGAGNEHLPSAVSQTEAGYLNGVTSDIQTQLDAKVAKTSSTGSGVLPAGTTAQRDGSPSAGYLRFNTTDTSAEIYDGSGWAAVGGGNSTDKGLYEHAHTISADYTITSGNNALTAGPITIDSGYSVTIPTGSTWVVA